MTSWRYSAATRKLAGSCASRASSSSIWRLVTAAGVTALRRKANRNVITPGSRSRAACHANTTKRHPQRTLSVARGILLPPGSKTCADRRPHCARSTLESHLQPELPELGVVKRSEGGRADVRLHVARQKRVERIVGAHADPRLQL